jgi:hypothetical protein
MDVMAKAATRAKGELSGWRLIAILLALAFAFQSYVAQTHIHPTIFVASAKDQGNKSPVDNSPLTCPFCQAIAHEGLFYLPQAMLLFLEPQWVEAAKSHFALPSDRAAPDHSWRSRAPPSTDR